MTITVMKMLTEHYELINDLILHTQRKKIFFRKKKIIKDLTSMKKYLYNAIYNYQKNNYIFTIEQLQEILKIDIKKYKYNYLKSTYRIIENDLIILIKGIEGEFLFNMENKGE